MLKTKRKNLIFIKHFQYIFKKLYLQNKTGISSYAQSQGIVKHPHQRHKEYAQFGRIPFVLDD